MIDTILYILGVVQTELLLFCVIWFLIGGIDDLLVDIIWMIRWCYRRLTFYRHKKPMDIESFKHKYDLNYSSLREKQNTQYEYHAIFIPAWREADVIGEMLNGCKRAWMNSTIAHRIYVGCYPNDNDTIAQVIEAAKFNPNISLILCKNDGPTTKADCLNQLWRAMLRDELKQGIKAKSVILHDAEDRPHADSLAIFDRLICKNDIVQLPVIPIAAPGSQLVSGHYCDEFCESHGKAMVVREAIGAAIPLAGVGCAIERNCLGRWALNKNGLPFAGDSVTEDYELGIQIGSAGRGAIMVRMKDKDGQLIGTSSYFPTSLDAAIKQKSRWVMGIALSGWDRLGWATERSEQPITHERRSASTKKYPLRLPFNMGENWMRLRDRRGIFSALTICFAYILAVLSGILFIAQYAGYFNFEPLSENMQFMILCSSLLMLWRLFMRSAFLYYHYGFVQACYALPRMITSNIIAILAARRAVILYYKYCFGGTMIWEKTQHDIMPPSYDGHRFTVTNGKQS